MEKDDKDPQHNAQTTEDQAHKSPAAQMADSAQTSDEALTQERNKIDESSKGSDDTLKGSDETSKASDENEDLEFEPKNSEKSKIDEGSLERFEHELSEAKEKQKNLQRQVSFGSNALSLFSPL